MSTNRIASRYVRRFTVTVIGHEDRFVHCHDAPVCFTQPGRRRF
ncbi:hypothetical protein [Billgrantia zhangzhouensis]|nr:hypothetical protein [Halomonas zhangzhouensis]